MITQGKQKYVYVILDNKNDKMIVENSRLPIFWIKKMANSRAKMFKNCRVEKVLLFELWKHIYTYPV